MPKTTAESSIPTRTTPGPVSAGISAGRDAQSAAVVAGPACIRCGQPIPDPLVAVTTADGWLHGSCGDVARCDRGVAGDFCARPSNHDGGCDATVRMSARMVAAPAVRVSGGLTGPSACTGDPHAPGAASGGVRPVRVRRAGARWRVLVHEWLGERGEGGCTYGTAYDISSDPRDRGEHATILPGTEFDELVVTSWLHLEQMDTGRWWMNVGGVTLNIRADRDGRPTLVSVFGPGDYADSVEGCAYELVWSASGGSTLDGPGTAPHSAADGPGRGTEGDRAREAVRDLLGPPVGSVSAVQRIAADAARTVQLATLTEAYQRGERDALDRADWHLRGEASRMRQVPLYRQRLAEWQQADTDDEVAYGLAYRRYVNLDARVRGIERAADHVADLARDASREGTTGAPAIDRALSGTGWTYADVTAALRNLLADSAPADCAWLLEALDEYRPRRGPGRRRVAVEPTGGTDG